MTFTLTPSKRRIRRELPLTRKQSYDLYIRSPEREEIRRRWKASRDNPGVLVLLMVQAWATSWTISRLLPAAPAWVPFVLAGLVWLVQRQRGQTMCLAGCTGRHTQQQHLTYWILRRAERKGLSMALIEDRQWVARHEWRWRWLLFIALCPWHHRQVDKSKHWARLRKRIGGHLTNWIFVLVCRARQVIVVNGALAATVWGFAHLTVTYHP